MGAVTLRACLPDVRIPFAVEHGQDDNLDRFRPIENAIGKLFFPGSLAQDRCFGYRGRWHESVERDCGGNERVRCDGRSAIPRTDTHQSWVFSFFKKSAALVVALEE
jgi:hypothetical protein